MKWHGRLTTHRITAVMVSTMLALPLPSMAQAQPAPRMGTAYSFMATPRWQQLPVRNEGNQAGVAIAKFQTPDGQEVTATYTQIDEKDAPQVFADLAAKNPDATILGVSGENDPILQPMKKKGFFSRLKSIVLPKKAEEIPAINAPGIEPSVRQKFVAGAKRFYGDWKNDPLGTAFTISYTTGMGTITYLQSGAVGSTVGQVIPTLLWSALMTVYAKKLWFKYMGKSGQLAEDLASISGKPLSDEGRYAYNVTGKWVGAFLANCLMASITLFNQGQLVGLGSVGFLGMLMNSNVVDPTMERLHQEGKISQKFFDRFPPLMQIFTASLELAAIFGIPYTSVALGTLVVSGLIYLYAGPTIERKVGQWVKSIRERWGRSRLAKACARMLDAPQIYQPEEEFISWAAIKYGR